MEEDGNNTIHQDNCHTIIVILSSNLILGQTLIKMDYIGPDFWYNFQL